MREPFAITKFSQDGGARATVASLNSAQGFTLIELLAVLGLIGLLATLGLPAIKGIGHADAMSAASRQLLDDLALARQSAIAKRTTVYMVFVGPNLPQVFNQLTNLTQRKAATNLVAGQYSAYALLAKRSPGDQPGRARRAYLTEWRSLPEGVIIVPNKFRVVQTTTWASTPDPVTRPLAYNVFPFPTSRSPLFPLPYIAFNAQGLIEREGPAPLAPDEYLPLERASVLYARTPQGTPIVGALDVKEVPPGNSTNTYQRVHLNWITGRARLEKKEIQ